MSLTPEVEVEVIEEPAADEELIEVLPSKTYFLDFENGKIRSTIDGHDAIRQYIQKAVMTARSRFLIYDDDYGCEIEDILANNPSKAFLQVEIPRVISEAIEYDDRIESTSNYIVEMSEDKITVSFDVTLINGAVLEGVQVSV
jgi:phage baseplate assembly protein W